MTATVLSRSDTDQPEITAVTFILSSDCLVTVRYAEPRPFSRFALRAQRRYCGINSAEAALLGLLETIIDRLADILERIAMQIDNTSRDVFGDPVAGNERGRDFQVVLRHIGRQGDLTSKVRESLASLERLLTFMQALRGHKIGKSRRAQLKTLSRDIRSLSDQVAFLSGKIGFLLDATLGLINIEQNGTIKIFSVMAVLFLPPTMIASIYGMNFTHMPELSWPFGYPIALLLMLLSAAIPYWFFKRRRWL
jgi:magnesium transporter